VNYDDKFWVRREEVWGGGYHWAIVDRTKRYGGFTKEAAARKLCARMNVDWQRYQSAMWNSTAKIEAKTI
jgi:hypothetical protein